MWTALERQFFGLFAHTGGVTLLLFQTLAQIRFTPNDLTRLLRQMMRVGVHTLPLAIMIGLFTGMIFSLNLGLPLEDFGVQDRIGQALGVALVRELAPVFTAFILAARVGAAMTAELGTMAVSDEINSLRVMGIRPGRFLAMPRVVASILMNPLLTVYSTMAGLLGGKMIAWTYFAVPGRLFWDRVYESVNLKEIQTGVIKAFVFGALYSVICVYFGMNTKGGADGVGRSTTRAVVVSLMAILVSDFLLTRLLFG